MSLRISLWLLLLIPAVCAAQDTNFATGPQYLITQSSTMFLHSIATPSLSFQTEAPPAPLASPAGTPESVPISQVEETPAPLPSGINLARIFWGPFPKPSAQTSATSEIAITSAETPANLPASIMDLGVTGFADTQSLREEGFGMSLGEVAAFWKAHGEHTSHTYTNKDVERGAGS